MPGRAVGIVLLNEHSFMSHEGFAMPVQVHGSLIDLAPPSWRVPFGSAIVKSGDGGPEYGALAAIGKVG
jgi:hypothetical protein